MSATGWIRRINRLAAAAIGLACLAAVLQPVVPMPVFIAAIGASLLCTAIGLVIFHINWRKVFDLDDREEDNE